MNYIYIALLLVVLVGISVGLYFVLRKNKTPSEENKKTENESSQTKPSNTDQNYESQPAEFKSEEQTEQNEQQNQEQTQEQNEQENYEKLTCADDGDGQGIAGETEIELQCELPDYTGKRIKKCDLQGNWVIESNCKRNYVNASKVKFMIPGDEKIINIHEILAIEKDNDENVALNKPAVFSSQFGSVNNFGPQFLTDGKWSSDKPNGDDWELPHTKISESNPSMEVDLQSEFPIKQVIIENRKGCCKERILGGKVLLYNDNNEIVWESQPITETKNSYTFDVIVS